MIIQTRASSHDVLLYSVHEHQIDGVKRWYKSWRAKWSEYQDLVVVRTFEANGL